MTLACTILDEVVGPAFSMQRRQGYDRLGQRRFVVGSARCLALRGPVLVQQTAGKMLRNTERRRDVANISATRGAW